MKLTRIILPVLLFGALYGPFAHAAPWSEGLLLRACKGIIKQPFGTFNHYCYGVRRLGEAGKLYDSPRKRNFILQEALGDFDYVLHHNPLNEKNRQHASVIAITSIQKGRALVMLRRYDKAIDAYAFAIQADPMQPKAYVGLSDVYKRQGMKELALEVIENGLQRLPTSKSLLRRKKRLQK